jgi:hypothetical protein
MDEGDFLVKSLETEPVKNLLGPITKELGLVGQDIGSVLRFYVSRNLESIFKKWAEHRDNKPLDAGTDMGRLMPLIQQASLQSSEELQARWAVLLENAATATEEIHPSFGQTLSQLTGKEAHFIDRLYARVNRDHHARTSELGRLNAVRGIYDPRLRQMSYADSQALVKEIGGS